MLYIMKYLYTLGDTKTTLNIVITYSYIAWHISTILI